MLLHSMRNYQMDHSYTAVYRKEGGFKDSDKYIVPKKSLFFFG